MRCSVTAGTKSQDIPREAFSSIGWHVAIHGQKSYNGVAIASRHQIDDVLCGLPGDDTDEQARYIEANIKISAWPAYVYQMAINWGQNLTISCNGWIG